MAYAKGNYAYGFCDRTGFRYPLNELVYEYKDGVKTGMRVGFDVVDVDHPQNFLGRIKINDPQSLMDPRPDRTVESLYGFKPVWNPAQYMQGAVGSVKIVTS
jgi:hypothetical protein